MKPQICSLKRSTKLTNLDTLTTKSELKPEISVGITDDRNKRLREYSEQLHANKLDNLGEMDKFLETNCQTDSRKSR